MPPEAPWPWKPLLVCPDSELGRSLCSALREAGLPDPQVAREYLRPGEISHIAERQQANICFLDVLSDQDRALQLVAEASTYMPVVALSANKDADLILRCLRRGAGEFLVAPTAEGVRSVLDRLSRSRASQPARKAGVVYCVVPGKPGAGASTVAVHLAFQMRAAGSVLLVDADLMSASIGFMLKLKSEFHLGDVVRDWKRMDDDLWARLTTSCGGIGVLLAPEIPTTRLEIGRSLAAELLSFWRDRYATVVLDLPDLRAAVESGFLSQADRILLVTTNELAALHATRRAVEFLDLTIGDRSKIHLVVNRYNPATGLKRDDVTAALQVEPYVVLSNDYDTMQEALLDGKPAAAGSRFRSSIVALAQQLQGKTAVEKRVSRGANVCICGNKATCYRIQSEFPCYLSVSFHRQESPPMLGSEKTLIALKAERAMNTFWIRFWKETRGQDLVEYALAAGMVAVAAVAAMPALSTTMNSVFSKIGSIINSTVN